MATYNAFNAWADYMVEGANLSSDQFVVACCNVAPVATNSVLADLTTIDHTNLSSRNLTTTSSSQTSGTYSLVLADLTLTASDTVPEFQYIVVYDDTVAGDPLVCWYDYGSAINMSAAETLLVNFGSSLFTLAAA